MNGKFIDAEVYSAKYRGSSARRALAKTEFRERVNRVCIDGLSRLLSIETIQQNIEYLENSIDVLGEEIRILQLSVDQGKGTRTDVWEKELERDELREVMLSHEYSLQENYLLLEAGSGLTEEELRDFLPLIGSLPDFLFDEEEIRTQGFSSNSSVMKAELQHSIALHRKRREGASYSPFFTLSVSVAPEYPPLSGAPENFSESFSRFGEEEGWVKLSGTFGIRVPLYIGGKPRYTDRANAAGVDAASLEAELQRKRTVDEINLTLLKRKMLKEQGSLYAGRLQLAKKQLQDIEQLFTLKRATKLEVERRRLQVLNWSARISENRKELFLNALRLLDLAGEDIGAYFTSPPPAFEVPD